VTIKFFHSTIGTHKDDQSIVKTAQHKVITVYVI